MGKVILGPQTQVYPAPALLIGANVNGKPNFMTAAWCGVACSQPPMLSVAIQHKRNTLIGIQQNMTFSANVPSEDLVKETDYCGTVSGKDYDKVKACGFHIFYGGLKSAPMIEQCPISLECKVVHMLELGSHILVIGEIKETHISEDCTTGGKADIDKIKPFAYMPFPARQYNAIGEMLGKAYDIGKDLIAQE